MSGMNELLIKFKKLTKRKDFAWICKVLSRIYKLRKIDALLALIWAILRKMSAGNYDKMNKLRNFCGKMGKN